MAEGTLYTFPENFRAFKALIAAQYSGAKIKVASAAPEFVFGETNKSADFLKKFPLGKVPAFEGKDGLLLFESNAIAYHVANNDLHGKTRDDAVCVQQWIEFADNEILPAALTWVFPCMGIMQYNKQNTEHAKEDVKLALGVLNEHLLTRTYLVGERITLADICVACNLLSLYKLVLEPEFRKPYQNVNRWFTTLIHQPQFVAVIGKDFNLCEKMAQFDASSLKWPSLVDDGLRSLSSNSTITIVESIPINVEYPADAVMCQSTFDSWMELIVSAKKSIDIVAFYWSLRGSDVKSDSCNAVDFSGYESASQGEAVLYSLLSAIKDRAVKVRVVNHDRGNENDSNTSDLIAAGADVRKVDFKKLYGNGVLHTKLLLIDGLHMYVGSANMDWRSLTEVKELGLVIKDCPALAEDAAKIFELYWRLGVVDVPLPCEWSLLYSTRYNSRFPMKILLNKVESLVYMSSSPLALCPLGRCSDLDAVLDVIQTAKEYIHVSVMDYSPAIVYAAEKTFWPYIDNALRKVSMEKGVKVRLLVSKWNQHTEARITYWYEHTKSYLQSLDSFSGAMNADIQVKVFVVPETAEQMEIPFSRVNHTKYVINEKLALVGTSNWAGDYFEYCGGVGLIINQSCQTLDSVTSSKKTEQTIQQQLAKIFDRDWNSIYAYPVSYFSEC